MKTRLNAVAEIILTSEEKASLIRANDLMNDLIKTYGTLAVLESTETGEIVSIDELMRVRGVLSAFIDYKEFKIDYK